jgi:SAM-dependent methyltransferase
MRDLLARLASRGALGTLLALMLLLPALLYIIATTLRDCMASQGCRRPARRSDRDAYVAYRYGGTQRFVNWREQRLVAALLRRIPPLRRVLDMPAGYGRFTLALQQVALEQVVCADIKPRRLRALARAPGVADRRMSLVAAELTSRLPRVSRRYVILSYYRGSNLHAVQREVQRVTRENGRRGPDMLAPRELQGLAQALGCRILADRPLLPWFHAQRVALLETTPGTREGVAGSHVARSDPAPHERG